MDFISCQIGWRSLLYKDLGDEVQGQIGAHCVILSKAAAMFSALDSIKIDGKELGEVDWEWPKLSSMRHRASKHGAMYMIPESSAFDAAIDSALAILEYGTEQ
jgi:hypothetical protein